MAISRIQQSQVSGSLSYSDNLSIGSGLAGKSMLSDDLNALRSLVKDIKGSSNWYTATTQDLSKVYAAMHASGANAAFQGAITTVSSASVGGVLYVSGGEVISGGSQIGGGLTVTSGGADINGAATLNSSLSVTGTSTLTGNVSATNNLSVGGTLGATGAATFGGGLTVNSAVADFNAGITADSIKIDGDSAGRLYVVGNDGSISDSANMWYDASGSKLYVSGAIAASGAVSAASAAIVGTVSAASGSFFGATLTGPLSVAGNSTLAAVSAQSLGVSGAATIGSTLGVTGAATLSSTLSVTGGASLQSSLGVMGAASFNSTLGVLGVATMNTLTLSGASGLTVNNGIADFNAGVTANSIKIDGDSIGRLYVVGSDGSISDSANLWYDASGSKLYVSGSAQVQSGLSVSSGGITVDAGGLTVTAGGLTVSAGSTSVQALSAAGSLSIAGAASFNGPTMSVAGAASISGLSVTGSAGLAVSNGSVFNGLVDVNAGMSASLIKIDGDVAQRLYIVDADGSIKDEQKLTFDGSDLSITGGLRVSGNAVVDGDLQVKGAFTYIETENMKVKDAFIYLATGSNGSVDSGIVLSKGAGGSWDLVVGQDGGAGELIFAKVATNAAGDSPADLNGAALIPAWMSVAKIGANEDAMVGSISKSGSDFLVSAVDATAELKFASAGNAAISFASAAQTPDASFQASTVVGMLNELRIDLDNASAGGNLKKQAYAGTAVSAGVLDFSGLGTLSAAQHKLVDIFVNGVLMAPGYDLTAISTTSVTFAGSYSFTSDDVIIVVIRG